MRLVLGILLILSAGHSARAGDLVLDFESNALLVSNITSGSRVYAYSEALEARGFYSEHVERETTLQESGGTAVWDIGIAIPLRSVWLAVNLTNGDFAVSPAPEFPAMRTTITPSNVLPDSDGAMRTLRYQGNLVWFVVVRPGVGAWRRVAGDGEALDADGTQDGFVTIALSTFQAASDTTSPAPQALRPGDVVFAYNAFTQRYMVGAAAGEAAVPTLSGTTLLGFAVVIGVLGVFAIRAA